MSGGIEVDDIPVATIAAAPSGSNISKKRSAVQATPGDTKPGNVVKDKAPKKAKKEKSETKEFVSSTVDSASAADRDGDGVVAEDGANVVSEPKAKRKPIRFNPNDASNYLDLNRFWKYTDSLNTGLTKLTSELDGAKAADDAAASATLAAKVNHYKTNIARVTQRRQDVMQQLKLTGDLLVSGNGVTTLNDKLLTALVKPFLAPAAPVPTDTEEQS